MKSLLTLIIVILYHFAFAQGSNENIVAASQNHESNKLIASWSVGKIQSDWQQKNPTITNTIENTPIEINVYPNPFEDKIFVRHSDKVKLLSISILNVLGVSHFFANIEDQDLSEIDTYHLASGLYTLIITTSNNKLKTYQLIKP